jgi:hypothetical protein
VSLNNSPPARLAWAPVGLATVSGVAHPHAQEPINDPQVLIEHVDQVEIGWHFSDAQHLYYLMFGPGQQDRPQPQHMTIMGAGYGLAQNAAALAEATGSHAPNELGSNLEEPLLCTTDTLLFLARYFDNLARAADRDAQPRFDPDQIGHWLRERAEQLRATAATFRDAPKA